MLAAAAGCSQSLPISAATTTDSAGVVIVDNRLPLDGAVARYRIDSVPVIDIGDPDDPHEEFSPRLALVRLRGGSIVVAGPTELRWFDPAGRWVRSVGRNGSGPGEFRQIDLLAQFADSVLVYDFALRRVSVFDSAGHYGRGTLIAGDDTLGTTSPEEVLADGRLLLTSYRGPAPITGLRRDPVTLRIGSSTGVAQSTLGQFPYVEQLIEPVPGGVSMGRAVFARMAYWRTLDTLALVATNERFSFDWYGASGRLLRSVRRPWAPIPVTQAAVDSQIEEWLREFPAGMEDRKAEARTSWSTSPRPSFKPPYESVLVSTQGEVWVQEYGRPVYSVFDRSGQWICQVSVPADVELKAIGAEDVVAVWRGPDDVPHIRVIRLRRAS